MISDLTDSEEVNIDVFVASWMKMRGYATSIDQQAVILQIHRLMETVRGIAQQVGCDPDLRRGKPERNSIVSSSPRHDVIRLALCFAAVCSAGLLLSMLFGCLARVFATCFFGAIAHMPHKHAHTV